MKSVICTVEMENLVFSSTFSVDTTLRPRGTCFHTFSQLLEGDGLLVLPLMFLVLLWQEVLLLCSGGQFRAFCLILIFPRFGQRLGQEPEGDAGQHDYGTSDDEAQPPGSHPAGVLVVNSDGIWDRRVRKQKVMRVCWPLHIATSHIFSGGQGHGVLLLHLQWDLCLKWWMAFAVETTSTGGIKKFKSVRNMFFYIMSSKHSFDNCTTSRNGVTSCQTYSQETDQQTKSNKHKFNTGTCIELHLFDLIFLFFRFLSCFDWFFFNALILARPCL